MTRRWTPPAHRLSRALAALATATTLVLPLGVAATAFVLLRDHGALFADGWWKGATARTVSSVVRSTSSIALALAYMAIAVLLFQTRARRLLALFAPVGRMALTHYLSQSLLGIAVFYGVGFGVGPRFGLIGTLIAAMQFDRTGTTRIGKYLLNHSFMIPGLICTVGAVGFGLLIGSFFRS